MPSVPQGVVQLFAHPPFGILSRETHASIDHTTANIQRIRGPVNVDAFGISFDFFTIPAAFGWTEGLVKRYENRILQFAPLYTDLAGHTFHSQITDVYEEGLYFYFEDLFPSRIDVYVTVGCVVIPYWLVAL
jgi:microsomal dipeptidase-like Zn-dependent dipeptidase